MEVIHLSWLFLVVKGEPFQIRSQPTELQDKKDWLEVNNN